MRILISAISGGLFGAGLFVAGMTDTRKVQGWLDVFGEWDPTLAFVIGGALVPMALAWRATRGRAPLTGGAFPAPPENKVGHRLVVGSVLFGIGWGLVGLCPGPAIASLSYGGTGNLAFLAAMLLGMAAAPRIGARLDRMAAAA